MIDWKGERKGRTYERRDIGGGSWGRREAEES